MAKASLDEQLAQAEERKKRADARYKRLQQKKQLINAKKAIAENAELKKQVAELKNQQKQSFDFQRELKQAEDSNAWLRGAVNNLVNDIQKLPTWNASEKDNKVTLVNRQVIINRLNGILKGQQPTQKK